MKEHVQGFNNLMSAHRALRTKTAKAVEDLLSAPDAVQLSHIHIYDGDTHFNLIRGVWMDMLPGVKMMLIDEVNQCPRSGHCGMDCVCTGSICTRVLCEARDKVRLSPHTHPYGELVEMIHGELIEHEYDKVKKRGRNDAIYYPAGTLHEPEIQGLMMVCWSPPLTRIDGYARELHQRIMDAS